MKKIVVALLLLSFSAFFVTGAIPAGWEIRTFTATVLVFVAFEVMFRTELRWLTIGAAIGLSGGVLFYAPAREFIADHAETFERSMSIPERTAELWVSLAIIAAVTICSKILLALLRTVIRP